MKHIALIVGILYLNLSFSQGNQVFRYHDSETYTIDDILFSINDKKPLTGLVFQTFQNGKISIECEYKNGLKNGEFSAWYENGNKQFVATFIDNVANSSFKKWHENGNLDIDCHYKNGLQHGASKQFYENGNLQIETFYSNGVINGYIKTWYESGQIRFHKIMKDGIEVSIKCWSESGIIKECE